MNKDDKEIIKALKREDKEAFDLLYKKYYCNLLEITKLYISDELCAKDIVDKFLIDFWQKKLYKYVKSNLAGYLYQSVKHRAIDFIKKQSFEKINLDENLIADTLTPDKKIIIEEQQKNVETILDILPPRTKQIFIMNKFDHLKYKEIASILDISPKTVEAHMSKALRLLKEYYKIHNLLNKNKGSIK